MRVVVYLLLSITFAALATITHNLGYGLFVIIAAYLLLSPLLNKGEGSVRSGSNIKTTLLILAAIAIPAFAIEAATGFKFSHALINKVSFHYELAYYLNFYFKNYWYLIIFSLFGFFSAPKEQKNVYWLVFLPIIGYLLALGFLTDIVHYRYMFAPIAGLFITGAAGLYAVITSITKKPRQIFGWTVAVLVIIFFFLSGEGIIMPKTFYVLESDSNRNPNRPYWGYTPQPNFNAAYSYIKQNLKPGDIVIASHPHFNKIFLNQPGYWIKYDYLGLGNTADTVKNNKEYYVGATVINNLDELKNLMSAHHGYITYDFMSQDGRISPEIINYIQTNAEQVFSDNVTEYSKIWVYKF